MVRVRELQKNASDRQKRGLVTKLLTVKKYADHRKVSEQRIRQLIDADKVSARKVKGRLMIDQIEADKQWDLNVDDKFKPRKYDEAAPSDLEISDVDLDDKVTEENAGKLRRVAEAKKEIWKAKSERLAYEEKTGTLVLADKVRRDAFDIARIVRDGVLGIPDRISAELVGINDQPTMHAELTKALNGALAELTDGIEKRFGIDPRNDRGVET